MRPIVPILAAATLSVALAQAAAAQSPRPLPEALPFGRPVIAGGTIDTTHDVWSRCRSADGSAGRWVESYATIVRTPTYVVDTMAGTRVPNLPTSPVECLGIGDSPGVVVPQPPATSMLPIGTRVVRPTVINVLVKQQNTTMVESIHLGDGDFAFSDSAGPVIVRTREITAFDPGSRLEVGRDTAYLFSRPGTMHALVQPTTCTLVHRSADGDVTATIPGDCLELARMPGADELFARVRALH